eukprot:GILJ01002116.1.p1 GENE.GILJ01002116.1~~GILJ01002116.1.p1  ORF type:complete len:559 (-),score=101.57 GILJ01002116.1:321-1997(-)
MRLLYLSIACLLCILGNSLAQERVEKVKVKDLEYLVDVDDTVANVFADSSYSAPSPVGPFVFFESFDNETWATRWVVSKDPKYNGEWSVREPTSPGIRHDRGLQVMKEARHYGIAAPFKATLDLSNDEDLVVQYEVKLQEDLSCGGAYIKLLHGQAADNLVQLKDDSPYVIMFGPDKCGSTNKVHFIFRHQNPVTQSWEEKHFNKPPAVPAGTDSHLYTLHVRKDNSFDILIDEEVVSSGNLLEDFKPPVNPPKTIDDPNDKKPDDWVDAAMIPDPEDKKPDDWDESQPSTIPDPDAVKPDNWLEDEPLQVADPEAVQPADWNEEEDGVWEAPLIDNPKCQDGNCGVWSPPSIANPLFKGKWQPRMIDNPAYKGVWKPRQIPNPEFFEDKEPHRFAPMKALAIEIWTMSKGIMFDNFLITTSMSVAADFSRRTFRVKHEAEKKLRAAAELASKATGFDKTMDEAVDFVLKYKFYLGAATCLTALLLYVCCGGRPSKPSAPEKKDDDLRAASSPDLTSQTVASANQEAEEEEEEEEEKEEEEHPQKLEDRQRAELTDSH